METQDLGQTFYQLFIPGIPGKGTRLFIFKEAYKKQKFSFLCYLNIMFESNPSLWIKLRDVKIRAVGWLYRGSLWFKVSSSQFPITS